MHLLSPRSFSVARFGTNGAIAAERRGCKAGRHDLAIFAQIFGDNPGGNPDFHCLVVKPLMPGSLDLLPVALSVPLVLVSQ